MQCKICFFALKAISTQSNFSCVAQKNRKFERALQYVQNVTPSLDFQFRLGQKKDFNGGKKWEKEQKTHRETDITLCVQTKWKETEL